MSGAFPTAGHGPFFASGAGAVTLVLLGAIASGIVAWFLRYRNDVKTQNRLLWTLQNAIVPEGRRTLVERVETVESNLAVCASELEAHTTLSAEHRRELLASIQALREWCESELRNRAA